MILSTRHPEQGPNLRHVTEMPEREQKPAWQERYEWLRDESGLYDSTHEQWERHLRPNQEVGSHNRLADAQFLNLLFLQHTDPAEATRLYKKLRGTDLWDPEHEQWKYYLLPNQKVGSHNRIANDQLLHILYLQHTDPAEATRLYTKLKATKLWNPEYEQWQGYLNPDQEVQGSDCLTNDQLLHILYLQQTNPTEAVRLYKKLKGTGLWDSEHEQWEWHLSPDQKVDSHNRFASAQLLGILVEKGFADREKRAPRLTPIPPQPIAKAL